MAVQDTDAPSRSCQDFHSLAAWLRLAYTPGVSRLAAYQLLQQYQSPSAVLNAANVRLAAPPASNDASPPPPCAAPRAGRAGPSPCGESHAGWAAPGPGNELSADVAARRVGGVPGDGGCAAFEDERAAPRAPARRLLRFEEAEAGAPRTMSLAAARLLGGPLPERLRAMTEATLAWANQPGNTLITLGDPTYPPALQHIPDPPLLLYAKGDANLLQREVVAVVGARNATAQGKSNARAFAQALGEAGLLVVSGLALGIDAAAHEGALETLGGTVAVIGTGIDRIYPRRNAALARRMAEQGCLLSEFPLGTQARAENFPIRNRIIAGMARATLVIEAAARSGSLITAHVAADFGRDVYALPGSIHAPLSKGCNALIREGATLVSSPEELLQGLGHDVPPPGVPQPYDGVAAGLLAAIGHDPVGADELASRLQLDPADTQASLLILELAGVVERLPGGVFQRLKPP